MDYKPIDYTGALEDICDALNLIADKLDRLTDYSAEIIRRDMFGPDKK